MHCEDHRRRDVIIPHGHHQDFHLQPVPSRPHLQTEEHQQAGADPPQPTAFIQVRRAFPQITDEMTESWLRQSQRESVMRGNYQKMFSAPLRGNVLSNLT